MSDLARNFSSGLMNYCNRCVRWSPCNNWKGNVCLFSFVALILFLPIVQPFYKYHFFKMTLFLQELSFGRAKGEVDPLSLQSERCSLSFTKSPFSRFTFQSDIWYVQASHGPVLQWSSRDKCCQTWRCLLLASVPWASINFGTPCLYNGKMEWMNGSGECQWLMSNYYFMSNRQNEQLARYSRWLRAPTH